MSLISLENIEIAVGGPPLLDHANLVVEPGERVCVVGRNGAGKSTLMRLMAGEIAPDDGQIRRHDSVVVARLEQAVPDGLDGSIFDVVAAGLGEVGALLAQHHALTEQLVAGGEAPELGEVQAALDAADGWQLDQRVSSILTRLDLPESVAFDSLSGGLRRRVLLARALVRRPDLLLLDEPTNHLDIEAIQWLEGFLRDYPGAIVFVTHDRAFLQAVATRIVEIDRGELTSWPGDYANFLRRKAERAHAEAIEQARFDKKLAEEEAWIRQGIKARRTRNEGRVRALEAMRAARRERRSGPGEARIAVAEAERSGKRVIEVENASVAYGDKPVVVDFSTRIVRGDRVGIIGPNGAGKTTLLRLMLGEIEPDSGTVQLGTRLEIAYFDQHRQALDDTQTARDNVAGGEDFIELGDGRRRHVMGYLQDFLFTPDRANAPISRLSGGERNRLLLARLFSRPSNLLVLDEPTNDLDVETLELLEERLVDYEGTLLLVSHDRAFLDNVVTSVIAPEGGGHFAEYVGGYADWQRQTAAARSSESAAPGKPVGQPKPAAQSKPAPKKPLGKKLSSKELRELEALPAQIEALEQAVARAAEAVNDPALYQQGDEAAIKAAAAQLKAAEADFEAAFNRWEALEARHTG